MATIDKIRVSHSEYSERLLNHMAAGTFGGFKKAEPPAKSPARLRAERVSTGTSRILFTHNFDGEKNLGEVGPIRSYYLDYDRLRMRSWQALLESEIAQIVINRFTTWVIGKGLRLQSEPDELVLGSEGIKINAQDFSKLVERRHAIWAKSSDSDYAGLKNKNQRAKEAFKNAYVGGDVLLILRYENDRVNIQLVDGQHIQSPMPGFGNEYMAQVLPNGNRIIHGVELSPEGEHVAYYVRKSGSTFETDRIPVRGNSAGLVMARLIYGSEYRLDNVRGLPLLSVILETAKKLERYKEATVGSAEERQKISYFIKHDIASDGASPILSHLAVASGADPNNDIPKTDDGEVLAERIAVSTNKQVFNMGLHQTLEALESKNELYFKDFYTVNIDLLCACVGIPPNVALSKYDSNYSASRAAIKDWEHTLNVTRDNFSYQFDQTIYDFWLEVEILRNKIQAPGYIDARLRDNFMALTAYRNARWAGANVPHIDPMKEVQAERLKLGATGASIPLTTVEAATEALNGGDSDANLDQFAQELQRSKDLGIELPQPEIPTTGTSQGE